MYKTKIKKIIATLLVATIAITYLQIIGVFAKEVYATNSKIEEQGTSTNNSNVEFDTYFKEEEKEVHTATKTISENNLIYAKIKVKNAGYLREAQIEIDESANFSVSKIENELCQSIEENKIKLNKIESGTDAIIELPISFIQKDQIQANSFSKENTIKLTGTYVDGNGDTKQIEKAIIVELKWKEEVEGQISQEITRYVPYTIGNNKGIILQTSIKAGIKDNKLPIKQEKIEVEIPKINEKEPTEIKVIEAKESIEKEYNKEAGKLEILVENTIKEDGTIEWNKEDEYIITYIYNEETLNTIAEEGIKIALEAKAQIEAYGNEQKEIEVQMPREEKQLKEKINEIVTIQTQATQRMSKGLIYSNPKTEEKERQETTYEEKIEANISYADLIDKLVVGIEADNFVITEENQESAKNVTQIKNIKINKENYTKILGEEGTILILSKEGATLSQITKQTEADEQGNIQIDLSEMNVSEIEIETSKPEKEGTLNITINKAINKNINLLNAQNYKALKVNTKIRAIKESADIIVQTQSANIELIEPISKIDIQINKETLSTIVENKNVEIKAILDTSSYSYALYKNPIIEIELPEYVEKISINSVKPYFNEELQVANYEIVSERIIRIILTGEQTKYDIGSVARGLNIVIDANITTKKLTPTRQAEIKMYVQHENNNIYEKVEGAKGVVTLPVQFVAPVGIVAASSISNYNAKNEQMVLISGEGKTAELDVLSEAKLATVENIIINNSTAPINNVSILGRTIAKGNKNIQTGEDLGTTFDAKMTTGIGVEGIDSANVTIYYSENVNATKNLEDANNGWSTQVQDLSKIKSYLVVLNNYQMEIGTIISLKYNTEIPEQLSKNQYGNTTYAVYYNNAYLRTVSEENLVAPITRVSTGEGPEIKVELSANVKNNEEVQEGQIIKYTAKITNTGKGTAEGAIVGARVPEGANYIQYVQGLDGNEDSYKELETKRTVTKSFAKLEPGESGEVEFEVRVKQLKETHNKDVNGNPIKETVILTTSAYGTALDLDAVASSNELTNEVVEGYITTSLTVTPGQANTVKGGKEIKYKIKIENINEKAVKNIVVKDKLPEGFIYKEAYYINNMVKNNAKYNEQAEEVTFEIQELNGMSRLELEIIGMVDNEKYEMTQMKNVAQIEFAEPTGKTRTISTNETVSKIKVEKAELTAKLMSDIPEGKIQQGELITYTLELKNTGTKILNNIAIVGTYNSLLQYKSSKYEIEGIESEIEGSAEDEISLTVSLQPEKTLKYSFTLQVSELGDLENFVYVEEELDVEMDLKIGHKETGIITTNMLKHRIVKADKGPQNPDTPTGTKKLIQGQVWIDENQDGIKDENETRLKDVEVMLFNYKTGKLVTNSAGKAIIVKTDENGKYEFTNLTNGKYSVIFLYDTTNYSSTTYRKEGVNPILNSDGIDSEITLDGAKRRVALTEQIDLAGSNIYNIDLGLIKDKKFDLKLEKTVASITVQNQTGTAKYEYNNKLAKRDLTGRYINNTTIVVEYKIAVTNEGAIEGYAKKIVDYIPSNFKFNAELNRDWYTLEDGSVCSSSLSNTKILPGETKEITLILTKSVKESDLTLITNTAEILEAYNDLGIADVDSTPGNKQSNEDDISTADILLTVRTGEQTVIFIVLVIGIITVIGVGIYFINKKVIKKIK